MIRSIKMQGAASFSLLNSVQIDTSKKVNLFYGLNGSGKSTISRFLQKGNRDTRFHKCTINETAGTECEVLVYNDDFVEENFYTKAEQPGIFSVGKVDVEAQKAIEAAEKEISNLAQKKLCFETEKSQTESQFQSEKAQLIEKVFRIKQDHDRKELDFCLDRKKNKEPFFEMVRSTQYASVSYTFEDLVQEVNAISKQSGQQKEPITTIQDVFTNIEQMPIWQEVIVGVGDSYLKELIQTLNNSDWISKGTSFISKSDGKCPFCQQNLPHDFESELKNVFDDAYQNKKKDIQGAIANYQSAIVSLKSQLSGSMYSNESTQVSQVFGTVKRKLLDLLDANLEKMKQKENATSKPVAIPDSSVAFAELNDEIGVINNAVAEFNANIQNPEKVKQEICRKFWSLTRSQFDIDIRELDAKEKVKNESLVKIVSQIQENENKQKIQREVISTNRAKISNVEKTRDNLNQQIELLGLDGFHIELAGDSAKFFRIKRPHTDTGVYKTLSEGEKTLISFLYFLEQCKGTKNHDSTLNMQNRIVVIDDPISSLSQNYVYEIANLIHKQFYKKDTVKDKWNLDIGQLFILTHSLFFFHELLNLKFNAKSVGANIFRVVKNDSSTVKPMEAHEVQNDYQAFWQVFRECTSGSTTVHILPNVMRNILEYYFSFIHKRDKLSEALESLSNENSDFKPLNRYVSRGSHSDPINISEFKAISPTRHLQMFKMVFETTGYLEHFNTMMEIEESTP
jgi:wobble nucleotide-excising tRNase